MRLSLKKAGALSTPHGRLQVDEALRPATAVKRLCQDPPARHQVTNRALAPVELVLWNSWRIRSSTCAR